MDNVFRISTCDFCGMEVRERCVDMEGNFSSPHSFEQKICTILMVGENGKVKKYTLCPSCFKAVTAGIDGVIEDLHSNVGYSALKKIQELMN